MSKFIENLYINNYRGIQNLKIAKLGSVNIFVGDNNTGKTSVLEAIQIFANPTEYTLYQVSRQRERYLRNIFFRSDVLSLFKYLFSIKESDDYLFEINGKIDNLEDEVIVTAKKEKKLFDIAQLDSDIIRLGKKLNRKNDQEIIETEEEIDNFLYKIQSKRIFPQNKILSDIEKSENIFEVNKYYRNRNIETNSFNINIIQTIDYIVTDYFRELLRESSIKNEAVELLKEFDENIVDIRYIKNENNNMVSVIETKDENYIPISLYGDGLKKSLTMLNAIIKSQNGILLIDEYEMSLHTSIMEKVFKFIVETARKLNVQLFLTTHSLEAVDKMLKSNRNILDDMYIIRLRKSDEKTFAKIIGGKEALENREEYDMELRV